jgi:nickel-dependent lactate racemase
MKECGTPELVAAKLQDSFQIGAHKAYAVTRLMKKARFILVSSLNPELAETLLFTPAKDMEEALRLASEVVGLSPNIVLMPQGSLTVPLIKK